VKKIILIVAVLIAPYVHGTILQKLSLSELKSAASSVHLARVTQLQYVSEGGGVWTIVTINIEKTLQGNFTVSSVRFRIPGGQQSIDGRTLVTKVDGVPEFHPSERGIFFLESAPPSYSGLLGWNQGFYRVIQRKGEDYVVRSDGIQGPVKLQEFLKEFQAGKGKVR
jgi:hypothetical protein